MPSDDIFAQTVAEAARLDDDALLRDWRRLRERLEHGPYDFADGHRLRQRHFAFQKIVVERFGVEGHVARYRMAAAG